MNASGGGASYAKEIFATLIESAPSDAFLEPVRLVVDDQTALQGRKGLDEGGRGCACASEGTVFVSRALLEGPATRIKGVLAHELGHVHLLQHGDENHSEREADEVARRLFRVDVGYDEDDVQTSGPGQRPRPARLDRRQNPGRAHADGCVVRSNPSATQSLAGSIDIRHEIEPDGKNVTVIAEIDGKQIGELFAGYSEARPGTLKALTVNVFPKYRRRGVASAMYECAEGALGARFAPSGAQSASAKSFWKARAKRGATPNPSATAALSELAEQDTGDFGEFYSDDPEELRESGEVRHGRKVVWVGSPGKMVEVDRNFVAPIQGNQFDPQKLAAVAEAVRDQSAPTESGKPVLYVGYGTVQFVTQSDIDEAGQYEDDEWPLDRDLDESDIGKLFYTMRDGNHRTFGALIGGETKVWMNLDANQLQDVIAWRARRKTPLPEYLAKNKSHLKLMKLLDEKLRND